MKLSESRTDWERIKREAALDTPIAYDEEDLAEGLYDPNDDAAVDAFFADATIRHGYSPESEKQLIQIPLSQSVLDYYWATGEGWEARIDEALVQLVEQSAEHR